MFIIKLLFGIGSLIVLHGYLPTAILRYRWRRNVSLGPNGYRLTFDDGPSEVTDSLIDLLNRYDEPGIFFLLGYKLTQYDLSIYKGHDIACHGYHHVNFALLDPFRTVREFNQMMEAFKDQGMTPRYFRAPYGLYNLTLLYLLKKANLKVVQWDSLLGDWEVESKGVLKQRLDERATDGKVVVLHDGTEGKADTEAKWRMIEELEGFLNENTQATSTGNQF
ncbi:polysaccharide deacetylase family protein [Dolosicoccus paucivorans]|uniref:NodB homology domain-containing protein n=1 Tax=Dolosicoccus paucivorans TaxID=84521 RepID=A0A2N6SKW0_9LACT|nr:polysaccharide deacetylase family protein [Dolosicoccus paucivorans]PMB83577.1 hypothetical protein CJ206_08485 [Dolosicoccus paucivorans]PMC56702.1 hypothetical protein CJ205_08360 [Dolosicoccus paucivorans]